MRQSLFMAIAGALVSGSIGAQCISANFTTTALRGLTGGPVQFLIQSNTGGSARTICGLQFRCKARSSTPVATTFSIWSANSSGRPNVKLRSGTVTVGTSVAVYGTTFAPLALAANTRFFVAFDNRIGTGLTVPIVSTGVGQTHYYISNALYGPFGGFFWNYNVVCCGNPGTYIFYGTGCKGTGGGGCGTVCGSHNANGGTLLTQTLPNEYCYGVPPSNSSRTVCGFQLYTRVVSGSAKAMKCAVYRQATTTTPSVTLVTTGTMTVGTAPGFYTVRFTTPITVPAGQRIWISQFDTNLILAASLSAGASPALQTFWRRPAGGSGAWSPTGIIRFPSWKLLCASGGGGSAVPLLTNTALPNIGKTFGLRVSSAKPNSAVMFWYGASRTRWGSVALPLSLSFLGAPACSLYASYDTLIGSTSNGSGVATSSFVIPNIAAYVGVPFYNQAFVFDSGANAAGLALTRGGAGKVGR